MMTKGGTADAIENDDTFNLDSSIDCDGDVDVDVDPELELLVAISRTCCFYFCCCYCLSAPLLSLFTLLFIGFACSFDTMFTMTSSPPPPPLPPPPPSHFICCCCCCPSLSTAPHTHAIAHMSCENIVLRNGPMHRALHVHCKREIISLRIGAEHELQSCGGLADGDAIRRDVVDVHDAGGAASDAGTSMVCARLMVASFEQCSAVVNVFRTRVCLVPPSLLSELFYYLVLSVLFDRCFYLSNRCSTFRPASLCSRSWAPWPRHSVRISSYRHMSVSPYTCGRAAVIIS